MERVLRRYFRSGGRQPGERYLTVPTHRLDPPSLLVDLTVLANFAEVSLAKEGHDGLVGINYLEKIQLPTLYALYGAMLAITLPHMALLFVYGRPEWKPIATSLE